MTKILIEIDPELQRVVPAEPTEEMVWVAARHYESEEYTGVRSTYRAMIAAAPQPEPVDVDLCRDAERYRWLSGEAESIQGRIIDWETAGGDYGERDTTLDAAIDAAMSQGEQK